MKIKNKILLLVMFIMIFSLLSGCGKSKKNIEVFLENISAIEKNTTEIIPVELPEGAKLTGFYMHQMGMEMMPYYILKTTDSGTYMKITNVSPANYDMWKDQEETKEQPAEYFGSIETVKDMEYASLVKLEDDALVQQIEECIVKYGALSWDGFSESKHIPYVKDADTSYNLYLELSDGTTVTMYGYNVCPTGFQELYSEISAIFQENSQESYMW